MSAPAGKGGSGGAGAGDSWERRAAALANDVQRWLIRTSARSVRDELGDQVRKAFRGQASEPADVWATATTEPPHAAEQPPECAWCPICRAARRMAEARAEAAGQQGTGDGYPAPGLSDIAEAMSAAARGALSGIDSILSYRPGEAAQPGRPSGGSRSAGRQGSGAWAQSTADAPADRAKEPEDEPDDRG